ncbi:hypothetical protein M0805_003038 [Coniferiporia weirii]|nr:hypothetical protein M0805_003038 [Coniferiporia weirii]
MNTKKRKVEDLEVGLSPVEHNSKKTKTAVMPPPTGSNPRPTQPELPPTEASDGVSPAKACDKRKDPSAPAPIAGPSKLRQVGEPSKVVARNARKEKAALSRPPASKIRKLAPPRPFPTVPTSVSATGPRSAHIEGKNRICITRRTPLGAYLRRCKDVVLKDGYKTLHLHALGAAIPHLSRLAVSLPAILPFPSSEIHMDVMTGTTELQDELIPDDEDEDITIRLRGKSTMSVVVRIGDGKDEPRERMVGPKNSEKATNQAQRNKCAKGKGTEQVQPEQIVFQEADLDNDDMEV